MSRIRPRSGKTRRPAEPLPENLCPLTKSQAKRSAAKKVTDTIQANFPPGVARPALRALAAAGHIRLEDLTKVRETDLAELHGMGPKALATLRSALGKQGKSFRE